MKTKTFDCVERVEQAQAKLDETLKGMTAEEQLEFWRKQTEKLRERQRRAQNRQKEQGKAS